MLTPILTASPLAQITRLGAAHAAALPTRPAAHIGGIVRYGGPEAAPVTTDGPLPETATWSRAGYELAE